MKINFFNLIIEILTILSIIFALAVITSTNPVIAICFLIALFLTVSFYLILMGLNFIGLSYLLVYIGAITVLVLFIVMMISTDILHTVEVGPNYSKLLPLAYSLAILFLLLFLITIPSFIIDFTSFELYNMINNFILSIFNKDTYKLNITSPEAPSLYNLINYYLNKLGLNFLFSENNNLVNNSIIISDGAPCYLNQKSFYYHPWINRNFFVEYNLSTYPLIGTGKNPTGFYYWHPDITKISLKDGLDIYDYYSARVSDVARPFPLGWYADDPYTVFTEWTSNNNIYLFKWNQIKGNFFTHWIDTQKQLGYNAHAASTLFPIPFFSHLYLPLSWDNYGNVQIAPWFTISPYYIWKTFSPAYGIPLHNYFLNLTFLNIPNYPEFLIEFPHSPVFSPNYFIEMREAHSFGEVYHSINTLNNTTNDLLINKIEPVSLLHQNLQIQSLGQSIFGQYALLLILSSFLLLLAMVAPILLTRTTKNNN